MKGRYCRAVTSKLLIVSGLLAILCLSGLINAFPSIAFDIASPFADPLKSNPKEIKTGVSLPGDHSPVVCQQKVDFSAPLALCDAVDAALCNNPRLKASWANIKIQAGILGEAKSAYLPTLSSAVNSLHSKSDSVDYDNSTTGVTVYSSVGWRLFDFGVRKANRQYAENLLKAAFAGHDAALQKTLTDVIQAYFDAHTARSAYNARAQAEIIAHQTLEAAEHREARGVSAVSDTLQAATAHARALLEKNRAQGNYEKAISVLIYSMGIPIETHIELGNDLSDSVEDYDKALNGWLAGAEEKNPSIREARLQLAAAGNKITVTRAEALPTIDFIANYFRNGYPGQALSSTQFNSYTVGLSLSVPIFSGFSTTYKIRGAEAAKEQRAAELSDIRQKVLMEVVKAYADASASLKNLKASETLIEKAKAAFESTRRRYEKGVADILEILNAQAALNDAGLERIRSLAEWQLSRLRLASAAGVLGKNKYIK